MAQYALKPGKQHKHDGENLKPGDIVELSDNQAKAFKDKFSLVGSNVDHPSASVVKTEVVVVEPRNEVVSKSTPQMRHTIQANPQNQLQPTTTTSTTSTTTNKK